MLTGKGKRAVLELLRDKGPLTMRELQTLRGKSSSGTIGNQVRDLESRGFIRRDGFRHTPCYRGTQFAALLHWTGKDFS